MCLQHPTYTIVSVQTVFYHTFLTAALTRRTCDNNNKLRLTIWRECILHQSRNFRSFHVHRMFHVRRNRVALLSIPMLFLFLSHPLLHIVALFARLQDILLCSLVRSNFLLFSIYFSSWSKSGRESSSSDLMWYSRSGFSGSTASTVLSG